MEKIRDNRSGGNSVFQNIIPRIDRHPVHDDFVMEMRSGTAAGIPYPGDQLPPLDRVPDFDEIFGVVTESGDHAVAMIDLNHVSITIFTTRRDDFSISRGADFRSLSCGDIQPLMLFRQSSEGGFAVAETGGHPAPGGPDRRGRRSGVCGGSPTQ